MSEDPQLFAFGLCKVYPMPRGRVLAWNPQNGRQAIIMPDVYSAMLGCQKFRTCEGHVLNLIAGNPRLAGQENELRQVLQYVQEQGLTVSADDWLSALQPIQNGSVEDPLVVVIMTWERPESLRRLLDSVIANCNLSAIRHLYVIDDSRSEDARSQNRSSTENMAQDSAAPVTYMGETELAALMQALIELAPEHEAAIRFLTDRQRWAKHWSCGLARTYSLLLSAGHRVVVLDDDTLCDVYEPYKDDQGINLKLSRRETAFYADNSGWPDCKPPNQRDQRDPLQRHAQVLGQDFTAATGALGLEALSAESFDGAPLGFIDGLRAASPVLISECGSLGDPGSATNRWLVTLKGASRDRLLESQESVECALRIRNNWSGCRKPTFRQRSNMSQMVGLDNRRMLPPYVPTMRVEDALFGRMTEFLYPGSLVLDNAWALPHLPIPERAWNEESSRYKAAIPFPGFWMEEISNQRSRDVSSDVTKRFDRLAAAFDQLADLSKETLLEKYLDYRLDALTERFVRLTAERAGASDAPKRWQAWLDDALNRLNHEIGHPPTMESLSNASNDLKGEALIEWWQCYWSEFAVSIRAWPEIYSAAKAVQDSN